MQQDQLPIDYENYLCTTEEYLSTEESEKYAKTICFELRDQAFINTENIPPDSRGDWYIKGDIYRTGITLSNSTRGWIATYCHKPKDGYAASPKTMLHCPFCGGKLKNF